MRFIGNILICAAALFIFGPGLIALFDLSCWFLVDAQCTSIEWTENRRIWAWGPWAFVFFIFVISGSM